MSISTTFPKNQKKAKNNGVVIGTARSTLRPECRKAVLESCATRTVARKSLYRFTLR